VEYVELLACEPHISTTFLTTPVTPRFVQPEGQDGGVQLELELEAEPVHKHLVVTIATGVGE